MNLLAIAKVYEKKVKAIHTTDHWFPKFLSILFWLFSLGKVSASKWRDHVALSVCGRIFFPKKWSEAQKLRHISHEAHHTTQQVSMGFGSYWVGIIPWVILYFLLPLPVGIAIGRCYLEIDAAKETWKNSYEIADIMLNARQLAYDLSHQPYGYAAPFFLTEWWCLREANKVINETK